MTPRLSLLLPFAAATALAATATATAEPVAHGGMKFSMVLTDEAEPAGGDVNASGTANIIINPGQRRVCWEITTSGVDSRYSIVAGAGAHIHSGAAGATGPIVIPLGLTLNGTNSGCTTTMAPGTTPITREALRAIIHNPHLYYVNLHWRDITVPVDEVPNYAAGALRAQLTKNQLM